MPQNTNHQNIHGHSVENQNISNDLKVKDFKKCGIMITYRVQTKRHFAKTHLSK